MPRSSDQAPAIEVRGVSKLFRLYHERYTTWRQRWANFGRIPSEPFWALDEVDFNVDHGSTVGLLGHNGSGKSTLLKCVAGILQPTEGEIRTHGRIAALLELGAGFNPELTGRENIFMNSSILGLTNRETERIFDDIVDFAELEKFIDMQVRHYSSGMYVRLGFAVAVNVNPDVLLVDEVLSVGDEAFQRKCLDRVAKFQKEGRTILVVTHSADLVRRMCDRAIVLDHGRMVADAPPGEAVRALRESMEHHDDPREPAIGLRSRVRITKVAIEHPGLLVARSWLLPNEAMTLRVSYYVAEPTEDLLISLSLYDEVGDLLFGTNTEIMGVSTPATEGHSEACFEFGNVPLLDGTYLLTIAIQSSDGQVYDCREQQDQFSVMNPSRAAGLVSLPVEVRFGSPVLRAVAKK